MKSSKFLSSFVLGGAVLLGLAASCHASADTTDTNEKSFRSDLPPLPVEALNQVATLPEQYPDSWMMVDDANFFSMLAGKVMVLDVLETNPTKRIKGIIDKSLMGSFEQSSKRNEIYILESFHERGTRGPQYEYLTIYDKQTLTIKKEILWPTDRLQALPSRYSMSLSKDHKFLYVANFTPASSFSVVDLDSYEVVDTIDTPGCLLTYPTGSRSVTSICSNGGLLSTELDKNGKFKNSTAIEPFFDSIDTPVFEHFIISGKTAYVPSFTGTMHMVDLSKKVAKYKGSWDMLTAFEREENYRPAGLVMSDNDDDGNIYVIMQKDGHEGSHQHGGNQVWVYDSKSHKRISVIPAPNHAISIAVSQGKNPKLIVTNGELALDIIDVDSKEIVQTISDFGAFTPLVVFKAN